MKRTQRIKFLTALIVTSGLAAVLVACSGADEAGGSSVVGTITGFGSVYIDGVKYENDDAEYKVDGDSDADQNDLEEGMVIICEHNGDNTCEKIHYDEDLEGPIASITENVEDGTKTLVVLGINVLVSSDPSVTNFDDDDDNDGYSDHFGWDYDAVKTGDIVEVSGVFNNSGVLEASYIEKEGNLGTATTIEVEFKGTITAFDESSVTVALDSNGLAVITVSYDESTDLSDLPGGVLTTGVFVEVGGMLTIVDGNIYAVEIEDESENEDDEYDDDHSSDSGI